MSPSLLEEREKALAELAEAATGNKNVFGRRTFTINSDVISEVRSAEEPQKNHHFQTKYITESVSNTSNPLLNSAGHERAKVKFEMENNWPYNQERTLNDKQKTEKVSTPSLITTKTSATSDAANMLENGFQPQKGSTALEIRIKEENVSHIPYKPTADLSNKTPAATAAVNISGSSSSSSSSVVQSATSWPFVKSENSGSKEIKHPSGAIDAPRNRDLAGLKSYGWERKSYRAELNQLSSSDSSDSEGVYQKPDHFSSNIHVKVEDIQAMKKSSLDAEPNFARNLVETGSNISIYKRQRISKVSQLFHRSTRASKSSSSSSSTQINHCTTANHSHSLEASSVVGSESNPFPKITTNVLKRPLSWSTSSNASSNSSRSSNKSNVSSQYKSLTFIVKDPTQTKPTNNF